MEALVSTMVLSRSKTASVRRAARPGAVRRLAVRLLILGRGVTASILGINIHKSPQFSQRWWAGAGVWWGKWRGGVVDGAAGDVVGRGYPQKNRVLRAAVGCERGPAGGCPQAIRGPVGARCLRVRVKP